MMKIGFDRGSLMGMIMMNPKKMATLMGKCGQMGD